jgi:hypothetical protein
LRDGDRATAEALLRGVEASRLASSPSTAERLDEDPRSLVRGELGILALAGDRFPEAAGWFARGERDVEAAYVADRVMSRDELLASARDDGAAAADDGCGAWQLTGRCWHHSLLGMYARRSVRVQRFDEALGALGAAAPEREDVEALAGALRRAGATTGIDRAEHLFAAARTLRARGMEIASTEVGPDWHIYEGAYEREMPCLPSPAHGFTRYAEPTDEGYGIDEDGTCALPTRADAALTSPLEITRVRASAPDDDQRFSYRYAASRLAEQAAALVPPRSQAYAALLCWAAVYAHRDPARVEELYAMYVRNGAAGFTIGEDCPAPDFTRARRFDDEQAARRARAASAARSERWSWPHVRAAVWRRRAWLVYPPLAVVLLGLSILVGRAALRRSEPL